MSQIPDMPPPQPPGPLMPLQPLTYETPQAAPRPGILTAIGVLSIIFACVSVLLNCGSVVNGVIFGSLRSLRISPSVVVSHNNLPPPPANHSGLSASQRQTVVAALNRVHPLPPARREMLERLLMEAGDDIFPFAGERFSDARITGSVSDSGDLAPETPGERGNIYFVLGNGRIELADDHATFSPGGGGQRIRVDRDQGDGDATAIPAAAAAATMPAAMMNSLLTGISRGTVILSVVDGVLGLVLAVFLFIGGIAVLRDSSSGRVMHLVYAGLKIPLAVLAAVSSWLFYTQITRSFAATPGTSPRTFRAAMGISSAFTAVFACMYPLALLIVMNLQSIKDYYIERKSAGR